MKKIILSLAVLAVTAISANAQTEKGTLLLGGGASFASASGTSIFLLNPNIGYFFAKNLSAGLEFALATSSGSTGWQLGPFVKPYFLGTDKGSFFGKGSFLVGGGTGSDTEFGFGIAAGYSIFLNKSIALEIYPQYTKIGKGTDGTFSGIIGFQIHFKK